MKLPLAYKLLPGDRLVYPAPAKMPLAPPAVGRVQQVTPRTLITIRWTCGDEPSVTRTTTFDAVDWENILLLVEGVA